MWGKPLHVKNYTLWGWHGEIGKERPKIYPFYLACSFSLHVNVTYTFLSMFCRLIQPPASKWDEWTQTCQTRHLTHPRMAQMDSHTSSHSFHDLPPCWSPMVYSSIQFSSQAAISLELAVPWSLPGAETCGSSGLAPAETTRWMEHCAVVDANR